MTTLAECCQGDTDKGWHGYLPHYERHLDPTAVKTLVEIGVYSGGSLRMFSRWIPTARIIGIDIEPQNYVEADDCKERIEVWAGDATRMQLPDVKPDVVIDDGSHHGDEQFDAFRRFWPRLAPGGWYVIEDLATIWGRSFRGGWVVWALIGHLLSETLQKESVAEVHVYEQIVFVKKR